MNVSVTASGGSNGRVDWLIDGTDPAHSVIDFPAKTGPHVIHFMLDDQTGRGLKFDPSGAFWADKNLAGGCPSAGSNCDQTSILSCTDKQLTVQNTNDGQACTVHYQLNLVDSAGKTEQVDPIFKNGGTA